MFSECMDALLFVRISTLCAVRPGGYNYKGLGRHDSVYGFELCNMVGVYVLLWKFKVIIMCAGESTGPLWTGITLDYKVRERYWYELSAVARAGKVNKPLDLVGNLGRDGGCTVRGGSRRAARIRPIHLRAGAMTLVTWFNFPANDW